MCRALTDVLGADEPGRVERVILPGAVPPGARVPTRAAGAVGAGGGAGVAWLRIERGMGDL